jgi:arginine decarboxylase
MSAKIPWNIHQALQTYQIPRWGAGYFSANEAGHMTVRPLQDGGPEIDLLEVVEMARERKLQFPLLLRFQDLLRHRVESLNRAFAEAIEEAGYRERFRGVFPIKVNQLQEVVEEVLDAGSPYHHGLEVGSKPELFAALALHRDSEGLIICNGFKDSLFVETALLGRKLKKKIFLVLEKPAELEVALEAARKLEVDPLLGVRIRLSAKGRGRWALSSGEGAKFGLSTQELLDVTDRLRQCGMERCLQLVHFHIGSQIPDIITIKRAVREAARYYARLRQLGFPVAYLDAGGGLGVDYDGSRSTDSSINYTLQEYARDVVYNVAEICDEEKVPHPCLVTESGRAVAAHHSVLVVDTFGSIEKERTPAATLQQTEPHKLVRELLDVKKQLSNRKNRLEHYHDALQIKEDALSMFDLGLLDLHTKAHVETLYWEISKEVLSLYEGTKQIPEEIRKLGNSFCDQFLCNFSVFQSLIDYWGLGQVFPIVPIHELHRPPTRRAILADITCDSDGKISTFIDGDDAVQSTLPLHDFTGKPYLVGIFLIGAYQDIMGDLHNLLGRVNEAHVFLDADEPQGFYIEETIPALTIAEALASVQYETHALQRAFKAQIDAAIKGDVLKPNEGMRLLDFYEAGLRHPTYLEFAYPTSLALPPAPLPSLVTS